MKPEVILESINVTKIFHSDEKKKRVTALKDMVLKIYKGQLVSLIGPSGCGKSTFLHLIAGFDRPTTGQLLLEGKEISSPGIDRGVCFQEFALFPWKNVTENVTFGLKSKGIPKTRREQIAQSYIDLVGLTGFEDAYPHELSGGMKQRCALIRTFAPDPEILLMDEPFGSLDAQTRRILQEELLTIWGETKDQNERKTILFVTHSIEEAVFLSDKIAVMTRAPGKIKTIVNVNLPRPRIEARSSKEFVDLSSKLWLTIREEIIGVGRT